VQKLVWPYDRLDHYRTCLGIGKVQTRFIILLLFACIFYASGTLANSGSTILLGKIAVEFKGFKGWYKTVTSGYTVFVQIKDKERILKKFVLTTDSKGYFFRKGLPRGGTIYIEEIKHEEGWEIKQGNIGLGNQKDADPRWPDIRVFDLKMEVDPKGSVTTKYHLKSKAAAHVANRFPTGNYYRKVLSDYQRKQDEANNN